MTLTPQDADEIARAVPGRQRRGPHRPRPRAGRLRQPQLGTRCSIYGTTPSFLEVRDWENMAEGEMFTDRDVRNRSKVCVIGTTLKRELFQGESPIGKEIRIQNVAFRVIGVLSRKGANMMGMDQDDIVLAPWTTIKYPRQRRRADQRQPERGRGGRGHQRPVNTLNNLYPGDHVALYSTPSATQTADTPQPVRFTNVDQILVKAATGDEIPQAIDQITELLRERHRIQPGPGRRLQHPRHDRDDQDLVLDRRS